MSSIAQMPVEEYLRYSGKPNAEYRDGVLLPKAMPTGLHAIIQYALLVLLRNKGAQALPELTVRINPTRFLVPDVCVVQKFEDTYPTEPALLCCEILSPDDRLVAMLSKCEEYHAWGVPYCWVIDPVKQSAWQYQAGEKPSHVETSLQAGELHVSLDELFSSLPKRP